MMSLYLLYVIKYESESKQGDEMYFDIIAGNKPIFKRRRRKNLNHLCFFLKFNKHLIYFLCSLPNKNEKTRWKISDHCEK